MTSFSSFSSFLVAEASTSPEPLPGTLRLLGVEGAGCDRCDLAVFSSSSFISSTNSDGASISSICRKYVSMLVSLPSRLSCLTFPLTWCGGRLSGLSGSAPRKLGTKQRGVAPHTMICSRNCSRHCASCAPATCP